jgi:hypothetical protein
MSIIGTAAYGFGRWNRARKATFALEIARRRGVRSVLLVGVSGARNPVNNLIEDRLAAELSFVVASGIEGGGDGWNPYVLADGLRLPFRDGSFDLVYANAVIEHVGGAEAQQRFLDEVGRVGRFWIVTTPNRTFPIEAHFHTWFSHWRPGWARGTVTRLLSVRDLRALRHGGLIRGVPFASPTLTVLGRTGDVARSSLDGGSSMQ